VALGEDDASFLRRREVSRPISERRAVRTVDLLPSMGGVVATDWRRVAARSGQLCCVPARSLVGAPSDGGWAVVAG
jgi:hypothetical protein